MEQDQDKGGAGGVCDVPVAMGLSLHAMALPRPSFCMIGHSPVRLLTQIGPSTRAFIRLSCRVNPPLPTGHRGGQVGPEEEGVHDGVLMVGLRLWLRKRKKRHKVYNISLQPQAARIDRHAHGFGPSSFPARGLITYQFDSIEGSADAIPSSRYVLDFFAAGGPIFAIVWAGRQPMSRYIVDDD